MGDSELIRQLARKVTGRTVCPHCAGVLLDLLSAVRDSRSQRDAAAGAADRADADGTLP